MKQTYQTHEDHHRSWFDDDMFWYETGIFVPCISPICPWLPRILYCWVHGNPNFHGWLPGISGSNFYRNLASKFWEDTHLSQKLPWWSIECLKEKASGHYQINFCLQISVRKSNKRKNDMPLKRIFTTSNVDGTISAWSYFLTTASNLWDAWDRDFLGTPSDRSQLRSLTLEGPSGKAFTWTNGSTSGPGAMAAQVILVVISGDKDLRCFNELMFNLHEQMDYSL